MCDVLPLLLLLKPPVSHNFYLFIFLQIYVLSLKKESLQQSVPASKGNQQKPVVLTNTP